MGFSAALLGGHRGRPCDAGFLGDHVADPDGSTFEDPRSQTTTVDQRSQDRLTDQLFEVLTRRTVLNAFQQHVANPEPVAQQGSQSHTPSRQIAAVLVDAERDSVLRGQPIEDLGLEERDLARAWIGRAVGVKAEPGEVSIASQAHPGHGLDCRQRLHGFAGAGRDMDRFDVSHNCRSITNASFTL
jgi:hypothetical protein